MKGILIHVILCSIMAILRPVEPKSDDEKWVLVLNEVLMNFATSLGDIRQGMKSLEIMLSSGNGNSIQSSVASTEGSILSNILTDPARDCHDILTRGINTSGVYWVKPVNDVKGVDMFQVYCDMVTDGGGWTVFQRRGDFNASVENFYLSWDEYRKGFGHFNKELWLGNDRICALTNQQAYEFLVDLWDMENDTKVAKYDHFWVGDAYNNYSLHIGKYIGTAGDSLAYHDKMPFSTKDRDNDFSTKLHCAEKFKGGWWYNMCHRVNLNGFNLKGSNSTVSQGINWLTWHGYNYSLARTELKFRPMDIYNFA